MAARFQITSVGEYCDDKEDFESYAERLSAWLVVNAVTDDQKSSVFLAVIGASTYKLLKSLLAPEKPNTKTFDELVNVLQRHYKPKPLIIAERFRFYKRQQQEGENVASFTVALRQLSSSCEFGAFLRQALRDQFVCGLSNQGIQRKLLAEANLTLDRALQLATAMSMATENTVENQKPVVVSVSLEGVDCEMHVDTGATVSLVSRAFYRERFPRVPLENTHIELKAYAGHKIPVCGQINVSVSYQGQSGVFPLVVVDNDGPPLLGRNWLNKIRLNWHEIFAVSETESVSSVLNRHQAVFKPGLGTIKGNKADIQVKGGVIPVFRKARPVPYAVKEKVDREIERLEHEGVIKKVESSEWASPIVCVPKRNGSIRICDDFKVSVNPVLISNPYPLPNAEDLFATLAGGKLFSKLDLSNAYQQLELTEESHKYLTINTHKGVYAYPRLTFGIATAPSIFQAVMDQILQGMANVVCYLDDIPIASRTEEEHLATLDEVLSRLEKYGVVVNQSKCEFRTSSVEYLGHRIDEDGLHPLKDKIAAIVDAPSPTNVSELRAYLGLINYYAKFMSNRATMLKPLHNLLRAGEKWVWSEECESVFQESKTDLLTSRVLVYYDSKRALKLVCDASQYGVEAVLPHVMDNGEERPIAFVSRSLTKSETNYAQLEKEALALIFGVKKFHKYLYGRSFTLVTDHRPLVTILGPTKAVPPLAAARMQRWALILQAYSYDVEYRPGSEHCNADALSRLPCKHTDSPAAEVFFFSSIEELPISAADISQATRRESVLAQVLKYTLTGWPNYVTDEELKPYFTREHELSTEQGCLLWGPRTIIPNSLRIRLLLELHEEHQGIVAMKAIARSYMWWPRLNDDIEAQAQSLKYVKQCKLARQWLHYIRGLGQNVCGRGCI